MSLDLDRLLEPRLALGAWPTPIQPLPSMSTEVEVDLKRDDLIGDGLTGTKVRALSFIIKKAIEDGVTDLITIGEPTSNQCRSVAILGARHGMRTHLLLRQSKCSEGEDDHVSVLNMFGARLQYLDEDEWRLHGLAVKRFMSRIRKEGGKALFVPFGCGGLPGCLGIVDLLREIVDAHGGHCPYSHIVVPTGSGSALFGLDLASQVLDLSEAPQLLGVSVSQDATSLLAQIDRFYGSTAPVLGLDVGRSGRLAIDDSMRDLTPTELMTELRRVVERYGILPDPLYVLRSFLALERLVSAGSLDSRKRVLVLVSGACRTLGAIRRQALEAEPMCESLLTFSGP